MGLTSQKSSKCPTWTSPQGGRTLGRLSQGRAWCAVGLAGAPALESSTGARAQPAARCPPSLFLFRFTLCCRWHHGLPRCPRQKAGHRPKFLMLRPCLHSISAIQFRALSGLSYEDPTNTLPCLLCSSWSKFIFLLRYWNIPHRPAGLQIQNPLPLSYSGMSPTLPFRSYFWYVNLSRSFCC